MRTITKTNISDGFTERELGEPIPHLTNNENDDKSNDVKIDLSKLNNKHNSSMNLSIIPDLIERSKFKNRVWRDEEMEVLTKLYNKLSSKDLMKVFPNRTKGSIQMQAFKLGLTYKISYCNWNKSELDALKENYGKKSDKEIQRMISRHTVCAILVRAHKLGFKKSI